MLTKMEELQRHQRKPGMCLIKYPKGNILYVCLWENKIYAQPSVFDINKCICINLNAYKLNVPYLITLNVLHTFECI